jgi:hypothetical protein
MCMWVTMDGVLDWILDLLTTLIGYGLDDREVGVQVLVESSCRPDRLWGLPNTLYNGYWGPFSGGKAAGA